MKIAFIGQRGIPASYSGVERWTEEIAVRLVAKNYGATVYCRYRGTQTNNREYKKVKLIKLPRIPTKHLDTITHTFLATIHSLIRGFDLLHYHALGPPSLIFLPKIFKVPIVVTIHGLDWRRRKWGLFAKLYLKFGEWMTVKLADKVIVVSQTLQKYFKEKYNKDTVYIPNGLTTFSPDNSCISKWNLEKNKYIIAVGRLVPEKRFDLLIEAFKTIKSDLTLVIVGEGSFTQRYVEYLKEISGEQVIFTGYVFKNQLAALYKNAYLFVNPSEIEGMPLVVLEAAGYECCILLSDIEEHKEILGEHAVYFKNNDLDNLKGKLQFLIENPHLVNEKKAEINKFVWEYYNWDRITEKVEAVYNEVVGPNI